MFQDHSTHSNSTIEPVKWGDFATRLLSVFVWTLGLLVIVSASNVSASEWRCGTEINGSASADQAVTEPALRTSLSVEAVDAFTSVDLPGLKLKLPDVTFVPEVEAESLAWLRSASAAKVSVTLLADRPDFLGRTIAEVKESSNITASDWQLQLLNAGLAMLLPQGSRELRALVQAEDQAISAEIGMWADQNAATSYHVSTFPASAGINLPSVTDAVGRFVVVDGIIQSIEHQEWRSYLNFGKDWRRDFTIALGKETRESLFGAQDFQSRLDRLVGAKTRVRGVIENRGGPYIALHNLAWFCVMSE
ncbi:MAG: hypothetical protein ACMZ66_12925 [Thalassospira sp.]|uniref:hypothetical protein n=1 Tax=Thalassospira sp. TaxID=1912094 RepID=UPI003A889566